MQVSEVFLKAFTEKHTDWVVEELDLFKVRPIVNTTINEPELLKKKKDKLGQRGIVEEGTER